MTKKKRKAYQPTVCAHCGQSTDYDVSLDRGTALIVLALYNAVRRIGRNDVHLRDDMEVSIGTFAGMLAMVNAGYMTSTMVHNVPRARYHGLIAWVEKGTNRFLITPKGRDFLLGKSVPRTAVIDKVTHTKKAYLDPDTDVVTFSELMDPAVPFWDVDEALARKYLGDQPDTQTQTLGL